MTNAQALAAAAALGLQRLDAQLLLLHALGRSGDDRAWLLAHDGDTLPEHTEQDWLALCRRRLAGEPVAYLVGSKEFYGMPLAVDRRVLVPRPDTETLVDWALAILTDATANRVPQVLDMGTGSGAIALAIARTCPAAQVTALDTSADALAVAQANARAFGANIHFLQSNWFDRVQHRFDLIVSNPPYVAEGDPHLAALAAEPRGALVAGVDGLADLRRIVGQAPAHLHPGGWLLLEHGHDQSGAVQSLLMQAGFAAVSSRNDLAGIVRCTGAQWPGVK